jgi:hypothetical protein
MRYTARNPGARAGRSTRSLRHHGFVVVGVDISRPMVERALAPRGRLIAVVSSPEIYVHEWASFSTRDFPENRSAAVGDTVRIVMLDVPDRRPVEDVLCTDAAHREIFARAQLAILETLRPLARGGEPVKWVSETRVAPWTIYVLGDAARSGAAT